MKKKQLINKWEKELYRTRELTQLIIKEKTFNPDKPRDYQILSMLMQDDRMIESFIHDLKRMV